MAQAIYIADPNNVAPTGEILVSDRNNARIVQIDDMTGAGWTIWALGVQNPSGVAAGPDGSIYVTDSGLFPRIFRLDDITDDVADIYGSAGSGVDQFLLPWGIFVP